MARTLKATDPKEAKPSKPKILIFGKPGVGKTWASLDFPSCYYIDTEGGADLAHYTAKLKKSGGMYLGPKDGANDFSVVTEEIITLATTAHSFRTLIIDSYSKLMGTQIATDHERMEKSGRDMEKTFGAEKKPAINWTRRWLRWFEKLDMNVILICHEKDEYKDGKILGQTFDGWDKLAHELHLALQIVKTGPSRKARVTKTRLVGFPDAEVFDWSYESFAERYGKDIIEAASAPVEMATPELIKRYAELMSVVKVDQKIIDKWEDNGGPEDLCAEDLSKRIAYLEKLIPKAPAAAAT
jgi:hypothetical protein